MRVTLFLVILSVVLSTAFAATSDQDAAVASLSKLISSLEDTLPVDSLEQIEEEDDLALGSTGGGGTSGGSGAGPVVDTNPKTQFWVWRNFKWERPNTCEDMSSPVMRNYLAAWGSYLTMTANASFASKNQAFQVYQTFWEPSDFCYTCATADKCTTGFTHYLYMNLYREISYTWQPTAVANRRLLSADRELLQTPAQDAACMACVAAPGAQVASCFGAGNACAAIPATAATAITAAAAAAGNVSKQFSMVKAVGAIVESDQTGVKVEVTTGIPDPNNVVPSKQEFLRIGLLCVWTPPSQFLTEQRFEDCPNYVYVGHRIPYEAEWPRPTNQSAAQRRAYDAAAAAHNLSLSTSGAFVFKPRNTQFYDGTTPVAIILNPKVIQRVVMNARYVGTCPAGNTAADCYKWHPNYWAMSMTATAGCTTFGEDVPNPTNSLAGGCVSSIVSVAGEYTVNRRKQVMRVDVQDEDALRTVRKPANWVPRCDPLLPAVVEITNAGDTLANQQYRQCGTRGHYYCTYCGVKRDNWALGIRSAANVGQGFGRAETWQIWWNPMNTPNGGQLRYQSYSTRRDFGGMFGPWEQIKGFANDRARLTVTMVTASRFETQSCLNVDAAGSTDFNGYYVIEDTGSAYQTLIRYRKTSATGAGSGARDEHIIIYQTLNAANANTGYWYMAKQDDYVPYYKTRARSTTTRPVLVSSAWVLGTNEGVVGDAATSAPKVTLLEFMPHWYFNTGVAGEYTIADIPYDVTGDLHADNTGGAAGNVNGFYTVTAEQYNTVRGKMTAEGRTADSAAELAHKANCPRYTREAAFIVTEQCVRASGSMNQQINQIYRQRHPGFDTDGKVLESNVDIWIGESFTAYSLSRWTNQALNNVNLADNYFLSFQGRTIYFTNKASTVGDATGTGSVSNSQNVVSTYRPYSTTGAFRNEVVRTVAETCPEKYY